MAITRLQQARQLYAVGQLVSKTLDGSRPGYRGEGGYQGGVSSSSNTGGGSKGGGYTGGGGKDASTKSFDKSLNPNRPGGPIGRDDSNAPSAYEMIGGKKFDVTPDTKDERERARVKAQIMKAPIPNVTPKGIEFFKDGISVGFAPTKTNPFSLKNIATNVILGIVAPQLLGPKFATGIKAYKTAQTLSKLAKDINLTDKNVLESFTGNLKSNFSDKFSNLGKRKKSTTTSSIDEDLSTIGNGNGGLESLGNMDALNQEYLLLLNKFNTGAFTDSDQVRFTFLKNMLGK